MWESATPFFQLNYTAILKARTIARTGTISIINIILINRISSTLSISATCLFWFESHCQAWLLSTSVTRHNRPPLSPNLAVLSARQSLMVLLVRLRFHRALPLVRLFICFGMSNLWNNISSLSSWWASGLLACRLASPCRFWVPLRFHLVTPLRVPLLCLCKRVDSNHRKPENYRPYAAYMRHSRNVKLCCSTNWATPTYVLSWWSIVVYSLKTCGPHGWQG